MRLVNTMDDLWRFIMKPLHTSTACFIKLYFLICNFMYDIIKSQCNWNHNKNRYVNQERRMDGCNGMTSKSGMLCIEKPLELPLAFCLHLIRFKYNDHFRLGALFVTSPKSQIILFTILLLYTKSPSNLLAYVWVI